MGKTIELTYQSQLSYATEAIKLSALANGGAAIALMTYLGSVAKSKSSGDSLAPSGSETKLPATLKGDGLTVVITADTAKSAKNSTPALSTAKIAPAVQSSATDLSPADLVAPVAFFAFGLLLAITSFLASYFTQLGIMKYWQMSEGVAALDKKTKAYLDLHFKHFILALGLILGSIFAFVFGALSASLKLAGSDRAFFWTSLGGAILIFCGLTVLVVVAIRAKIKDPAAFSGSPAQTPRWAPRR